MEKIITKTLDTIARGHSMASNDHERANSDRTAEKFITFFFGDSEDVEKYSNIYVALKNNYNSMKI